ncbi:MAG: SDR family oxidoreductase [Candidatus Izemoplasmatales bacterium]
MRILITGNLGQIATNFIKLYSQVHQIDGFDRGKTPDNYNFDDYDVCLHLGALTDVSECEADNMQSRVDNYHLTCRVLDKFPKRIVFTSSAAVYGNSYPETNPISMYGTHKYLSEKQILRSGVNHAIVRLSNVFGINKGVINLIKTRKGKNFTVYGDPYRDFIHVDDVCYILEKLCYQQENLLMNVSSNHATSVLETAEKFCHVIRESTKAEDIVYSKLDNTEMLQRFPLKLKTVSEYL